MHRARPAAATRCLQPPPATSSANLRNYQPAHASLRAPREPNPYSRDAVRRQSTTAYNGGGNALRRATTRRTADATPRDDAGAVRHN